MSSNNIIKLIGIEELNKRSRFNRILHARLKQLKLEVWIGYTN